MVLSVRRGNRVSIKHFSVDEICRAAIGFLHVSTWLDVPRARHVYTIVHQGQGIF